MKSKVPTRSSSKDQERPITALQREIKELKRKCEDLSRENAQLEADKKRSEEKSRAALEELKQTREALEELKEIKTFSKKMPHCEECEKRDEKIAKLEKDNHTLKENNWHLKMVKLPHYVKLLHQKDEEIAKLDRATNTKGSGESLLHENSSNPPEEITLDEDEDEEICEIEVVPIQRAASSPTLLDLDDDARTEDSQENMIEDDKKFAKADDEKIFAKAENDIDGSQQLSEKSQLNNIIDSLMQSPDSSTIKEEEATSEAEDLDSKEISSEDLDPKQRSSEDMINALMRNISQKTKAILEAKKVSEKNTNNISSEKKKGTIVERESEGEVLESDVNQEISHTINFERESEDMESGEESESSKRKGKRESEHVESGEESESAKRVKPENVGPKSGKRKRKLFNSFCDDLMDEKGEVRQQVIFPHF